MGEADEKSEEFALDLNACGEASEDIMPSVDWEILLRLKSKNKNIIILPRRKDKSTALFHY